MNSWIQVGPDQRAVKVNPPEGEEKDMQWEQPKAPLLPQPAPPVIIQKHTCCCAHSCCCHSAGCYCRSVPFRPMWRWWDTVTC